MSDRNYRQDIKVDFARLEENLASQGGHYLYWGEKWANTEKKVKERKRKLSLRIRKNPDAFGLHPSPSESSVKAKIDDDEKLIELEWKLDVYKVAKEAFGHRRSSLDGLTRLYVAGYFSKPSISQGMIEDLGRRERENEHDRILNEERVDKNDEDIPV